METGEEIIATKAVISALNVKQLFLKLMKEEDLPAAGFQDKIRRIRQGRFVTVKQNFSTNELLKFRAGEDVSKSACVRIMPLGDDILKMFSELDRGIPQSHDLGFGTATLVDPTRAPEGKHCCYMWLDEPSKLKDGGLAGWDEIKDEIMDGAMATLGAHTTNFSADNLLERFSCSPLDLERHNPSWIGGDANHLGLTMAEMFSNRPMPGWGNYKTPVQNLYICGASTHPGPAVIGGARAAVPLIMQYLGLKFDKVLAKW